jgi:hypothetical protein
MPRPCWRSALAAAYVRFCERLGVKFPGPTRLKSVNEGIVSKRKDAPYRSGVRSS